MPRSTKPEVVVIYWRDIPAQVNGQHDRSRHQIVLPERFQRAIDRAKRKAGIDNAHDDVAQWRRVSHALDEERAGDVATAAQAEADRLAAEFPSERLGTLAFAGGWLDDVPSEVAGPSEMSDSHQEAGR